MKVLLYGDAGESSSSSFPSNDSLRPTSALDFEAHRSLPFRCTETDASPEATAQLSQEAYNHDVLLLLVERIGGFEFEVRSNPLLSPSPSRPLTLVLLFPLLTSPLP